MDLNSCAANAQSCFGPGAATLLASQLGASTETAVAPAVELITPDQAIGPSGVHPKNWLTTGVWTMATKTPALPSAVAKTSGLWRRVSRVCASCVVTNAVRPIVAVRRSVPGVQRPMAQAAVAPAAVTAPRVTIWRMSGASSEGVGAGSTH